MFLLIIFCLYLFYFINYNLFDYTDVFTKQEGGYKNLYGLGYSLKVSNLLFDQRYYSFLLNLAIYVISFLIILLVINSKVQNLLIISFFYLISLFLFPLMQEYFDPYIFIIGLLILKNEYHFNLVKCTSYSYFLNFFAFILLLLFIKLF